MFLLQFGPDPSVFREVLTGVQKRLNKMSIE